jgi:predicted ATPase
VPRQRSLRDAVHWSHALLDEAQRQVWRRLAVFRGAFTLDAAQAVCADPATEDGVARDAPAKAGRLPRA